MKEQLCAVRRQDENSLLALHCLTTGHAFNWTRVSVVGNGTTKRTREFIEAWKTMPTCVNQCMIKARIIKPCGHVGNACARNHKPSSFMKHVSFICWYKTGLESSLSLNIIPPPCPLYMQFSNVIWRREGVPDQTFLKKIFLSRRSLDFQSFWYLSLGMPIFAIIHIHLT